jgi:hypothetical protein
MLHSALVLRLQVRSLLIAGVQDVHLVFCQTKQKEALCRVWVTLEVGYAEVSPLVLPSALTFCHELVNWGVDQSQT